MGRALPGQFESKSPTLCTALQERVSDSDPVIRGEALVGLARRGDVSIAPIVQIELEGEFHGDWAVEAAALLANPPNELVPISVRPAHDPQRVSRTACPQPPAFPPARE